MSFTDNEIFILFGLLAVAVAAIIVFMKRRFANQSDELASKYHSDVLSASLKKYPEADSYKMNNTFFKVGLICAVAMSVLAFNWTTFESRFESFMMEGTMEIETDTPIILPEQKTPPPPPPPPVIDEVDNDDDIDDDFDFSQNLDDEDFEYLPYEDDDDLITNNDQPKEVDDTDDDDELMDDMPFIRVENMPTFPGCGDLSTEEERKTCSDNNLLKYVYQNLKYPTIAKENGIEGLVIAQFVVGKDGKIQSVGVVKDIGGGCGEELTRVLNSMNSLPQNWKAGEQRGRKVPVRFNIPIRFQLNQK